MNVLRVQINFDNTYLIGDKNLIGFNNNENHCYSNRGIILSCLYRLFSLAIKYLFVKFFTNLWFFVGQKSRKCFIETKFVKRHSKWIVEKRVTNHQIPEKHQTFCHLLLFRKYFCLYISFVYYLLRQC